MVVKINAASICGTDFRTYIHGSKNIIPGTTIGHEMSGTIVEIGSKVKGFSKGERILVAPAIGCGQCNMCKGGHTNMCDTLQTIGFQYDGSFAEYMQVPAQSIKMSNVIKLPPAISDEEAAIAEPIACVLNAHEFLNIEKGDCVVIFGSGFIGTIHAELAFLKGASKVIVSEPSQNRVEAIKKNFDNIYTINPTKKDPIAKIKNITNGHGADVVIVACSSGKAQEQALEIAAKRGRISLFGGLPNKSKGFLDSNLIHYKELGVFGVHASTPKQNKEAISMIADKTLNAGKYISKIYSLNKINEAFEAIKNENYLKVIIRP